MNPHLYKMSYAYSYTVEGHTIYVQLVQFGAERPHLAHTLQQLCTDDVQDASMYCVEQYGEVVCIYLSSLPIRFVVNVFVVQAK